QLSSRLGVPDLDGALFESTRRDDAPPIRAKCNARYGADMAVENGDFLLARHIPNADNAGLAEIFFRTGPCQARAIAAERQAANLAAGIQGERFLAGIGVPEADAAVVATGNYLPSFGIERHAPDFVGVADQFAN